MGFRKLLIAGLLVGAAASPSKERMVRDAFSIPDSSEYTQTYEQARRMLMKHGDTVPNLSAFLPKSRETTYVFWPVFSDSQPGVYVFYKDVRFLPLIQLWGGNASLTPYDIVITTPIDTLACTKVSIEGNPNVFDLSYVLSKPVEERVCADMAFLGKFVIDLLSLGVEVEPLFFVFSAYRNDTLVAENAHVALINLNNWKVYDFKLRTTKKLIYEYIADLDVVSVMLGEDVLKNANRIRVSASFGWRLEDIDTTVAMAIIEGRAGETEKKYVSQKTNQRFQTYNNRMKGMEATPQSIIHALAEFGCFIVNMDVVN
ncbi:MAG: hypothetical protein QXL47_00725 [Candidatus Anstonellales archaeon]